MKAHLLEELVDALTAEYRIKPKGIRGETLLLYLNTNPTLKLDGAIALWRKGRISLAKAAEIVGLTVPEFKDVLAAKGIVRETEGKSAKALDSKLTAELLKRSQEMHHGKTVKLKNFKLAHKPA